MYLRSSPKQLAPNVLKIAAATSTRIIAFELDGRIQVVKYIIRGKWRDCYSAARLIWYRLTNSFTTHIHGSWSSVANQRHDDIGGQSLANLYHVSIDAPADANVLSLTGSYWNVMKFRRELVIRQRKSSAADRPVGPDPAMFPSLSSYNQVRAGRVINSIRQDLATNPGNMGSLEMLQLLFGQKMVVTDPRPGGHRTIRFTNESRQSVESCSSANSSDSQDKEGLDGHSPLKLDLINYPVLGS
jgi:hypothetical protein